MGCDPDHKGGFPYDEDKIHLHNVYLDIFYIDKTEVTNRQYAQCVADEACDAPSHSSSSTRDWYYDNSDFSDFPVIYVDCTDSGACCDWTGKCL